MVVVAEAQLLTQQKIIIIQNRGIFAGKLTCIPGTSCQDADPLSSSR